MAVSGAARLDGVLLKTISMPLLQIPLTKRMAASDTARLDDVLLKTISMPLLQISLAVTAFVTLIVICHRRVFGEVVQAETWLHSKPGDGRRRYNSSLDKERDWCRRTVAQIWGDV
jgi:hypothetical protein